MRRRPGTQGERRIARKPNMDRRRPAGLRRGIVLRQAQHDAISNAEPRHGSVGLSLSKATRAATRPRMPAGRRRSIGAAL